MLNPTTSVAVRIRARFVPCLALLFWLLTPTPSGGVETPAHEPCNYLVTADTDVVDGNQARYAAGPGTVICLAPGERGNLKLINLHGSLEAPVIVRNAEGPAIITGRKFEAGILIAASTHLRITGTGVASECGAGVQPEEQACGIRLEGTNKGIRALTSRGPMQDIEIDHVSIARLSVSSDTRGIAIHPVEKQVITGIRIHHNRVSGAGAEAIYVGSEPRDTPWADLGKVDAVEIGHNLIEDIGWDGIKLKVALGESRIHDNVIRNSGMARYEKHQSGITVAMSVVDVHDNAVSGAPEGIKSGRSVAGSTNRFHGNLVTDVLVFGIQTEDAAAQIYNNTVAGSGQFGIRARGEASRIIDNIVADAPEPIVARPDARLSGNLVGSIADVGFVDPEQDDFRPREESAAVGRGRITRLDLCARAGMRAGRPVRFSIHAGQPGPTGPVGCRADLGAGPSSRYRLP